MEQGPGSDVRQDRTNKIPAGNPSGVVVLLRQSFAAASGEQVRGIDQIDRVTQENAASAEELAAIMATFVTRQGAPINRKTPGAERLPVPS